MSSAHSFCTNTASRGEKRDPENSAQHLCGVELDGGADSWFAACVESDANTQSRGLSEHLMGHL